MFYEGTQENDYLVGTDEDDYFVLNQGGNDRIGGGAGNDWFEFGSTFGSRDIVDGGSGSGDSIYLSGDYSTGLVITNRMLRSVEYIYLGSDSIYNIVLGDIKSPEIPIAATPSYPDRPYSLSLDSSAMNGDLYFRSNKGDDSVVSGSGNDFFSMRFKGGSDSIDGGAGYDRVSFLSSDVAVLVDLNIVGSQETGFNTLALANIEGVTGSHYGDRLVGDGQDNLLISGGGNDVIFGSGGDDFVVLGTSDLRYDSTDATIRGGDGTDTVDFSALDAARGGVSVTLVGNDLQDTGQGFYRLIEIEDITATAFDDDIIGNRRTNTLFGGSGSDTLSGGDGNDVLHGDAFKGITYYATRNPGPVAINQNATAMFSDILDGGAGKDRIFGDGGDDIITGGLGADRLSGGNGADLFRYTTIQDSGRHHSDVILDFATDDRIDLAAIDADRTVDGDQAFHLGSTQGHAGDIVVTYDDMTDRTVISIYVDADRQVDAIIYLAGEIGLTEANFVF